MFRKFWLWKVAVLFSVKIELPGFFRILSLRNTYHMKKERTKSVELEDSYVALKNADKGPKMSIFYSGRNFEREFVVGWLRN